eukprot:COSAG01_NODE_1972_length_8757_cov_109.482559_3_plen_151_part_00
MLLLAAAAAAWLAAGRRGQCDAQCQRRRRNAPPVHPVAGNGRRNGQMSTATCANGYHYCWSLLLSLSQRSFHGASRRHSASLLITLRHAVCQVPACAQKRLAAAELVLQQQCQRCSSSAYGSGGGAAGCCCCCSRCCDDGSSRLDVVRTL